MLIRLGPSQWVKHSKGTGGGPRCTHLLTRAGRLSSEEPHFLTKSIPDLDGFRFEMVERLVQLPSEW